MPDNICPVCGAECWGENEDDVPICMECGFEGYP